MQINKDSVWRAVAEIARATATSFTICVLCWSVFWLLPDWNGTGVIGSSEVVAAVWVSLGICVCMSVWGFACFSETFAKKASRSVRYLVFAVVGYGIISAWVLGSGWCPPEGFALFTIACVIVLVIVGIATGIGSKRSDALLNEHLDGFKRR